MFLHVLLWLAMVFAVYSIEQPVLPRNDDCIPGKDCQKGDLIAPFIADCCYTSFWACDATNDGWWERTVDVAEHHHCQPCPGEHQFICGEPQTDSRCVCDDTATYSFEWNSCRCQYWPHGNPHVIPASKLEPSTSLPIPAKNISTVMPTNSSITTPAANISTTMSPTNSSITTPAANRSTTASPTNSSITTPGSNISTTVLPTNSSFTTPAANISTTVPLTNGTTTNLPNNFTTNEIPTNFTTTEQSIHSTTPSYNSTTGSSTTVNPHSTTGPSNRKSVNAVEIAVPVVIGIVLVIVASVIIALVLIKKPCKSSDYSSL